VWSLFATINQMANATGQGLINPKLHATTKANLRNLSAVGFIDIVHGNNADLPVPGYGNPTPQLGQLRSEQPEPRAARLRKAGLVHHFFMREIAVSPKMMHRRGSDIIKC